MNRLSLVSLVFVLSACDGTGPGETFLSPTPPAGYTLSGIVSEMRPNGPAPIAFAALAQTNPPRGLAFTDANGRFSATGLPASTFTISVTRDGFVMQTIPVTMSGDTQLDIRLERVANYILSGVVFEMTETGQAPVAAVEIYCDSCGSPDGHTFVNTDANGLYRLAWAVDGLHPLFVTKTGYEIFDPTGKLLDRNGRITATVKGDTRFDIQLVRK